MDFSVICRMCLGTTSSNPIFKNEDDQDVYSKDVYKATGVMVRNNDELPQNICASCENMIDNILMFRKQCEISEAQLLSLKPERKLSLEKDNNKIIATYNLKNEMTNDLSNDMEFKEEPMDVPFSLIEIESINLDKKEEIYIVTHNKLNKLVESTDKVLCDDKSKFSDPKTVLETKSKITEQLLIQSEITLKNKGKLKSASDNTESCSNLKNTNIKNKKEIKMEVVEFPYIVLPYVNNEKNMRVICKLCQMELSIRSIDMHMAKKHPGADERKVKCDMCDVYILKENLSRHTKMMHGSGSLKCIYCKSEFDDQAILIEHVQSCPSKSKKRRSGESARVLVECDVCNKKMLKASLRIHKAIMHGGMKPVCEHCGRSFGNKHRLHEHYRAKHGYEKFKCSYCDFASANIVAMRNHERRHRGEKPFQCDACGAKFHAAYLLSQHKQTHRTERIAKCDLCPASFKANNNLHMHKLTCHSKSLYKCTMCDRAYSCRHYAAKHLRVAHNHSGPELPLQCIPRDINDVTE